jgi:hypothetical protein
VPQRLPRGARHWENRQAANGVEVQTVVNSPSLASYAALVRAAALCVAVAACASPAHAQVPDPERAVAPDTAPAQATGWNSERVLEMVGQARQRRQEPVLDESLRSYKADVAGHIYFFLDRRDEAEPVLLRADQVALDLYWAQPDQVRQIIRGMRHEEQFPIRDFRYYLDRYTVIHDGFGDEIRVGDGMDVRNVAHPLAPGAELVYEYRLADSTSLQLPGAAPPILVYEVQVRPRDFNAPAIIGSLYIERARADLVRLAFTFTRAAYLDPRNERVEIMLENGLWEGRHWLPREQRLMVRREMPQFDFEIGTVIRATLRVASYDLNVDLPRGFFAGPPVVLGADPQGLRAFPFREELYDGLEAAGFAPGFEPGSLANVDVDAIAGRILRERYLSGVPAGRLHLPAASRILRYGRTEGLATEVGMSIGVARSQLALRAGYAWGSEDPLAEVAWRPMGPQRGARVLAEAYLNRPLELGLRPAAAGAISTIGAAFGSDYRDVHPATGARVGVRYGDGRVGVLRVAIAGESHRQGGQAATDAPLGSRAFRPVAPAEQGTRIFVDAGYDRRLHLGPMALVVRPGIEAGFADFDGSDASGGLQGDVSGGLQGDVSGGARSGAFGRGRIDIDATWMATDQGTGVDVRGVAAAAVGTTPAQHLWYLGGPNTLPGHPFHAWVGDRAAVADVAAWQDVIRGLVRVRLFAAAGWSALDGQWPGAGGTPPPSAAPALATWTPQPTGGVKTSVGVGVGLIHGVLRLDYAVPTDTWAGRFIFSVDPRFWHLL